MPSALPRIVVSQSDHAILESLLNTHAAPRDRALVDALSLELARADVLSVVPPGVVGLGSTVTYREGGTHTERTVRLVLPQDADSARGAVSVLAPIGCAILGLAAGASIEWPLPNGRTRVLEIVHVEPKRAA